MEFNQGDIGLPGGVQVLEPANVSSVTVDSIKRYGGSTAPTMPWPEEESLVEEDRFDRLEKLILKRQKRSDRKATRSNGALSSAVSGLWGLGGLCGGVLEPFSRVAHGKGLR